MRLGVDNMGVLLVFFGCLLPWILFVIPMVCADKKAKDILSDFSSNPMDCTE